MKALIVSDRTNETFLIGCALETLNVRSVVELSTHDIIDRLGAIDALRNHAPDLIIADLALPTGVGLEFLRMVREQRSGIPFAMLVSPNEHRLLGAEVMSEGADALIRKPFSGGASLRQLQGLVSRRAPKQGGLTGVSETLVTECS